MPRFFKSKKHSTEKPRIKHSEITYLFEAKSYVLMTEPVYNANLDVKSIFEGKRDHIYQSNTGKISISFEFDCQLFISLDDALKEARFKDGKSSKSAYIMRMGYGIEEVAQLVSQGHFSQAIISAINAKDLNEAKQTMITFSEVENIINHNFQGDINKCCL